MGKGKKLAILLAVVVVLVGGYIAAKYFFNDAEDAKSSEEDNAVSIGALEQDDIVGIQYNYGDEVITLKKEGDKWLLDGDKDFPVEQAFPDLIASDAAKLTAKRLISDNPDDFAEYGLSEPSTAYVFTKADGTQVTYLIGSNNNVGGTYYMNVAGTNEIYLIEGDFLDDFDAGTAKLADVPEMETASTDQVTGLRLTLDGKTTVLQNYEDGLATAYSGTLNWFVGKDTPADTVAVHDFIGKAVGYSSDGCAAYKADEAKLASFGLNEPVLTLAVQYNDSEEKDTGKKDEDGVAITETVTTPKSLLLTVGKQSPDGTYYAKPDGGDAVYLIAPEYVDTLREFDVSSLRAADVCKLSSDEVTAIDVTLNGKTHTIKIERGKENDIRFAADGKQITAVQFNDFFSSIQSAVTEGFANKKYDADEAMRIVYHTNRMGFETVTLIFAQVDRNLYVVQRDGGDGVLIDKTVFEEIRTSFEALIQP